MDVYNKEILRELSEVFEKNSVSAKEVKMNVDDVKVVFTLRETNGEYNAYVTGKAEHIDNAVSVVDEIKNMLAYHGDKDKNVSIIDDNGKWAEVRFMIDADNLKNT